MKKTLLASTLALASGFATAAPVFHPSGASLSYGDASITQNIFSNVANPAAGATIFERDSGEFRMGVISSVGMGMELGQLDSFVDQYNALQTQLNQQNQSLQDVQNMKAQFDEFLVQLGDEPYLMQLDMATHVPGMPLVIASKALGGSFVFDANIGVQAKTRVLDSPLEYNATEGTAETNSAVYVKAGTVAQASLGYSRKVLPTPVGSVYAGVRANYYYAGLRKTLLGLATADNIDAVLQAEAEKSQTFNGSMGLDAGVLLVGKNFQAGASVNNLVSPEFEYLPIGQDCASIPPGPEQDSCYIAQSYADEIDLVEKHVMNPQARLDAAFYSGSRNWVIGMYADANPINDLLGNPTQRAGVSAAYATRSWIIPGLRVGVHTNLVGTQLSYAALGMSIMKSVHLDVAYGLDTVTFEGSDYPRKLAFNLGVDLNF